MTNMTENQKIAAYALDKAKDIFYDVKMKGPCRCREFNDLVANILKDMDELEWVIHCWNEERKVLEIPGKVN